MKKLLSAFVLSLVMFCSVPALAANFNNTEAATSQQSLKSEASQIEQRVKEIRAMNKKNLTATDKKNLRSELMNLKKKTKDPVGIYVSGSALLIIIILLIILL